MRVKFIHIFQHTEGGLSLKPVFKPSLTVFGTLKSYFGHLLRLSSQLPLGR